MLRPPCEGDNASALDVVVEDRVGVLGGLGLLQRATAEAVGRVRKDFSTVKMGIAFIPMAFAQVHRESSQQHQ